jgi:serine/threonine protein kinase
VLFESYVKNFDEELSQRRGSNNYWTEEELFNTFQACLSGLKVFHDNHYVHGAIGPQSIIFSQEGFVKIADNFVVSDNLKKNWLGAHD